MDKEVTVRFIALKRSLQRWCTEPVKRKTTRANQRTQSNQEEHIIPCSLHSIDFDGPNLSCRKKKKVSPLAGNESLFTGCCEMLQQEQNSQPNYAG